MTKVAKFRTSQQRTIEGILSDAATRDFECVFVLGINSDGAVHLMASEFPSTLELLGALTMAKDYVLYPDED